MNILYLHIIDEDALLAHVPVRRIGTWEGTLPDAPLSEMVRTTLSDGCSVVQAKGSAAAYNVLEGLLETEPFEDGELIRGMECLPIAAFYPRMYEPMIGKLAEVLSRYDRVIARNFANGKPGRPFTNVGSFPVQVYDNHSWVAPGAVSEEYIVWEVERPTESEEPAPEEKESKPATAKRVSRKRKTTKKAAKGT